MKIKRRVIKKWWNAFGDPRRNEEYTERRLHQLFDRMIKRGNLTILEFDEQAMFDRIDRIK